MADIPVVQFPPGRSPVLTAAITMLLCAALGGIVHITASGVSSDGVDEAGIAAMVTAARDLLVRRDGLVFEQAKWREAGEAASA